MIGKVGLTKRTGRAAIRQAKPSAGVQLVVILLNFAFNSHWVDGNKDDSRSNRNDRNWD